MDYANLTAPCGIPCFECGAYKARSNEAFRRRISETYGMDLDKSACEGCRNRNGKAFLFEKNRLFPEGKCVLFGNDQGQCKIYLCAGERGIHNCGECGDFPCDMLRPFADKSQMIPHNTKTYNLCLIKKMGLEKWAKENAGNTIRSYFTDKFGE